jgi:lysyl-tRNA synthetase class 2
VNSPNDIIQQRYKKLEEIRNRGINPYPYRFDVSHPAQAILDQAEGLIASETVVTVAGRLISKREHGGSTFAHLLDRTGRIQIYVRIDRTGEEAYDTFIRLIEVGDYLGVRGTVFRTRTGEVTVLVRELTLLAKALRPLPEKWHGLRDVELRYRQRYMDLIITPGVRERFIARSRLIRAFQRFMDAQGFIEVETPVLQPLYGGALARPFVTHHHALDMPLYLRISDELYLKRLIVGGLERVYEIGHDFRNEGVDRTHNPEFTMLEFYQAYADYTDIMRLTEEVLVSVVREVTGSLQLTYQGQDVDLTPPWRRLPMLDAIKTYAEVDVADKSEEELDAVCRMRHVEVGPQRSRGQMINALFETCVQPHLINPTFIMDYPVEVSPLAKRHRAHPGLTERFECFICGHEYANAFSELNDPIDQRMRFELQMERQRLGDGEAHMMDEDYLRAMEHGMPPTGGCGIGIDRLMMLITDAPSIKDVLLFPHMRPESDDGEGQEEDPGQPAATAIPMPEGDGP